MLGLRNLGSGHIVQVTLHRCALRRVQVDPKSQKIVLWKAASEAIARTWALLQAVAKLTISSHLSPSELGTLFVWRPQKRNPFHRVVHLLDSPF